MAVAAVKGAEECEVAVMLDGARRIFTMANQRLVDGGLKAGLDMPYACKSGVCSNCRAHVLTGEVDMDNNFALKDYEVARGFVLCFQSFPVSDKLVIDFDQEHN